MLSFVKGCVHCVFWFFSKMICHPIFMLASPNNIGVHNSILEYVSTTDISTTPPCLLSWLSHSIPFHLKRNFWFFSSFIIKIPKSSKLQESANKMGNDILLLEGRMKKEYLLSWGEETHTKKSARVPKVEEPYYLCHHIFYDRYQKEDK
jgi:hypothetical protein